ncbi:cobalt transport protein [Actinobaculum suis]|uniref:Cobalt transport protein n=1 Tax=Actinobaculum suis TaxID=1657 RepID=A0A1B9BE36_9ACTO|nr:energy-coupling factor transporter transmembrane component T [Actinobaculum suis]OCA95042.1 hypothetical protein ACU20_04405 [Actinobaculum suis]OCA95754.1 hypothetical protein ACU21_02985 [Actinobaculum suis]VDG75296.1 cobalt transport protein [Actinobaculum suis]
MANASGGAASSARSAARELAAARRASWVIGLTAVVSLLAMLLPPLPAVIVFGLVSGLWAATILAPVFPLVAGRAQLEAGSDQGSAGGQPEAGPEQGGARAPARTSTPAAATANRKAQAVAGRRESRRELWARLRKGLVLLAIIIACAYAGRLVPLLITGRANGGAEGAREFGATLAETHVLAARLAAVILLATWVNATTRSLDLAEGALWYVRPLARLRRFDVDRVRITLLVAMRMIPIALAEIRKIREAQNARGSRSLVPFGVALVVKVFRRAEMTGDALISRGAV